MVVTVKVIAKAFTQRIYSFVSQLKIVVTVKVIAKATYPASMGFHQLSSFTPSTSSPFSDQIAHSKPG